MKLSRRELLKCGVRLGAALGIGPAAIPRFVNALDTLQKGEPPVVWLQGQSCSGCSVSFLNSNAPSPVEVLTHYLSLNFHSTLSTATGKVSMSVLRETIDRGGFFLVVEGSVPENMPHACVMGGIPISEWIVSAARKAQAVIAIGTCASFGGIPAAENNPTGAIAVPEYLQKQGISAATIRLPGCPCHPDWLVGTLAHVLSFGLPPLDESQRPLVFYEKIIHDQCPRFSDYERERFAKTFGDEGCLFRLGCVGPNTHADCTLRQWNAGVNTCIKAGGPCIGCASAAFAKQSGFAMYPKNGNQIGRS